MMTIFSMHLKRNVLIAVGLVAIATLALGFAYPMYAAVACPACVGLVQTAPGVYAGRGLPDAERARLIRVIEQARARVAEFYGSSNAQPRVLVCTTTTCRERVRARGPARGVAIKTYGLLLLPGGDNVAIATHELSHIAMKTRLAAKHLEQALPRWFNEGLAVYVSDDPRYLRPRGAADRCLVQPTEPLPTTLKDWLARAQSQNLYPKAACQVSRWIGANGGDRAAVELLERVAAGISFAEAYARPTQPHVHE